MENITSDSYKQQIFEVTSIPQWLVKVFKRGDLYDCREMF
jgi:hypothetical protein